MASSLTLALPRRAVRPAAIVLVLLAGVLTGAQLGKVAPLIPWYQEVLGLSLVSVGWLAALLGIFIAVAAVPAGIAIERFGLMASMIAGTTALAVGGLALALSSAPAAIFAARLVEAVGYLSLCITLPAILNRIAADKWRGPVLAIWSGFVPLGFATSDFLAAALIPAIAPQGFLVAIAVLFAVLAVAAMACLRGLSVGRQEIAAMPLAESLTPPVVLLAFSFGCYVVLSVSLLTFLPTFVAGDGAHYLLSAGAVALTVPIGNFLAGFLVHGRGARFMAALAISGFTISATTAAPAFIMTNPLAATSLVVLLAISGAVVASAQFAAIPYVVGSRGSVPVALGLVSQAGGIGTLFGPPIAAWIIDDWGWNGFGWFLALTAVVGLAAMLPLLGRRN